VLDTNGRGTGWSVAQAMFNAVDSGCKVINLSLVMSEKHSAVDAAIEYARNLNVVVIAAAGNDNSSLQRFPAGDSYALSVTGVDSASKKPDFANYGNYLDVCAPSVELYAPFPDSSFATWSGTSFAAPIVAAQAAWLFSLKPDASWEEVVDAIRSTAINIDSSNPNLPQGSLGNGLIDIRASFAALGLTCGDIDGSGTVSDVGDLTSLVDHLFISFGNLPNIAVANIDGQAGIDIGDLTTLIDHLFITFLPINCGW
jgi:subtilisin family serine protease